MTEEQKEILIAKMLDSPSSLSYEELDTILEDDELKDIYEISSVVKGACVHQPNIDIEDEWVRFRARIKRKPVRMRWVMWAAIFFGVAFASGIMVNFIDGIRTSDDMPVIAKVESASKKENTLTAQEEKNNSEVDGRNITSATSPIKSAAVSKLRCVKSGNSKSKAILKTDEIDIDEIDTIDIDEYLRIQQASIDNDIALQVAELYKDEFNNLSPLLHIIGEYDKDIDKAIIKVTIQ